MVLTVTLAFWPQNHLGKGVRDIQKVWANAPLLLKETEAHWTSRYIGWMLLPWGHEMHDLQGSFWLIYLYCSTFDNFLMKPTLFATNVWNLLESFLIYFNTAVISVQHTDSRSSSLNSALGILSNHTANMAAVNSNLQIVICFKGATRAFPMRNVTCLLPWPFVINR